MIAVSELLDLRNEYQERCLEIQTGDKYPFYAWCCQNVPGYKTLEGNLAFRKQLLIDSGNDLDFKNDLWTMCCRDILFYINTFVFTYDPRLKSTPTVPFITYPYQDVSIDSVLKKVESQDDIFAEKSRDMGASWIFLTTIQWLWQFKDGLSFLLGSRTEDYVDKRGDSKALMWKIDYIIKHQPRWLSPNFYRTSLHIENVDNLSTIDGESTTGDFARGGRWTIIMLDEFAAVEPDGEKVLKATRDATRIRIFNSTHQGAATSFYRIGQTNIFKLIMHWSLHPEKNKGLYYSVGGVLRIIDPQYSDTVVVDRVEYSYKEDFPFQTDNKLRSPWYDNECSRAAHPMEIAQELDIDPFSSDFQFFDPIMIAEIEKNDVCHPFAEGTIDFDEDSLDPLGFVHLTGGNVKLWVYPDHMNTLGRNMEIICGADVSAGTGASNSALSFADLRTGEKIASYADPWIKPEAFARLAIAYCKYFNDAFMIPDGAGPGRTFCDEIIRLGYRNLYYRRNEEGLSKKVSDKPGVFLNPKEKKAVLTAYRRSLKDKTYIQRGSIANQECLSYIYTSGSIEHSSAINSLDPSGAGDSHGDRVIADALASKGVDFLGIKGQIDEGVIPVNSYAYKKRERELKNQKKKDW